MRDAHWLTHMHMHTAKQTADWLAAHSDIVIDQERATAQIGKWQDLFDQEQPIHVEIGSGKGQFILGMALAHPEINYIGMEIQKQRLPLRHVKVLIKLGSYRTCVTFTVMVMGSKRISKRPKLPNCT